jgi:predicted regulator of amino acid metabolism with ACT domain
MIEGAADFMPHKFRTLPSREHVVEHILSSGTK